MVAFDCPNCQTRIERDSPTTGNVECPNCAALIPVAAPQAESFDSFVDAVTRDPEAAPSRLLSDEEVAAQVAERDRRAEERRRQERTWSAARGGLNSEMLGLLFLLGFLVVAAIIEIQAL